MLASGRALPEVASPAGSGETTVASPIYASVGGRALPEAAEAKCRIYVVSDSENVRRAFLRALNAEVHLDSWTTTIKEWRTILRERVQGAQAIWIQLPSEVHSSLQGTVTVLSQFVTHAIAHEIDLYLMVRYSNSPNGIWLRSWKKYHGLLHTKHCTCMYGVQLNYRKFHSRYNVLTRRFHVSDMVCAEWRRSVETAVPEDNVKANQLSRYFLEKFAHRWLIEPGTLGNSTLQIDPSDSLEAQDGPDSSHNASEDCGRALPEATSAPLVAQPLPSKAAAYPTDARERQKQREKQAKESGTPLQVKKKHKHVEEHYDDCGDDISSLHQELETYVLEDIMFTTEDTAMADSTEHDDADLACWMLWGSDIGSLGADRQQAHSLPNLRHPGGSHCAAHSGCWCRPRRVMWRRGTHDQACYPTSPSRRT